MTLNVRTLCGSLCSQSAKDLAAAMPPGQYVYHPACHCSRCLDKRQAASMWDQFRMILKSILKNKVTSGKQQAASNKRLTK
jgi:hypothetical protein